MLIEVLKTSKRVIDSKFKLIKRNVQSSFSKLKYLLNTDKRVNRLIEIT